MASAGGYLLYLRQRTVNAVLAPSRRTPDTNRMLGTLGSRPWSYLAMRRRRLCAVLAPTSPHIAQYLTADLDLPHMFARPFPDCESETAAAGPIPTVAGSAPITGWS